MKASICILLMALCCGCKAATIHAVHGATPSIEPVTPSIEPIEPIDPLVVTNYGAKGDARKIFIAATSGLNLVTNNTGTFTSGDIGKLMVIDGSDDLGATNSSTFGTITNLVSSTVVKLDMPVRVGGTNVYSIYGTDSQPGFNAAIAAAITPNGTIIVPGTNTETTGQYLLISRGAIAANGSLEDFAAMNMTRAGIRLLGDNGATLIGNPAPVSGLGGGFRLYRGYIFAYFGDTTNCSETSPFTVENLTIDGGVQVGHTGNPGDWDEQNHWLILAQNGAKPSRFNMINCSVVHWRGEAMGDFSGKPNPYLYATNCYFADGQATLINNFSHNLIRCNFNNVFEAEEFYRDYNTNLAFITSCTYSNMGQGIALVGGGAASTPAITFSNCYFDSSLYGTAIQIGLGCNMVVVSNTCRASHMFIDFNTTGAQGSGVISNVVVYGNTAIGGDTATFSFDGGVTYLTQAVRIYSNNIQNAYSLFGGYGWVTNSSVFDNTGSGNNIPIMTSFLGQWVLDSNNSHGEAAYGNSGPITNTITYALGSLAAMAGSFGGSSWLMDDTQPNKIPPGAQIIVRNADSHTNPLWTNTTFSGTPFSFAPGDTKTFNWSGASWSYVP